MVIRDLLRALMSTISNWKNDIYMNQAKAGVKVNKSGLLHSVLRCIKNK